MAVMEVRAERAIDVGISAGGAILGGIVEGVLVMTVERVASEDMKPIFTWGTLITVPLLAGIGAILAKGRFSDLLRGVAAGGVGIIGYVAPKELSAAAGAAGRVKQLAPGTGAKQLGTGGRQLSASEIKQLLGARSQAQSVGPQNPGVGQISEWGIPVVSEGAILR